MTAAAVISDRISGKHDCHDSDTIAMPDKARRNIFRVSRRRLPLYSARHHHAARQASRRPTPGDASGHTPCVASGRPTVVIISPPELGGVRGGLNRRRGSLLNSGAEEGLISARSDHPALAGSPPDSGGEEITLSADRPAQPGSLPRKKILFPQNFL